VRACPERRFSEVKRDGRSDCRGITAKIHIPGARVVFTVVIVVSCPNRSSEELNAGEGWKSSLRG
jgi:hypothetical protein